MALKPEKVCRKHAKNPSARAKQAKAALARIRRHKTKRALARGEEPPPVKTKGYSD